MIRVHLFYFNELCLFVVIFCAGSLSGFSDLWIYVVWMRDLQHLQTTSSRSHYLCAVTQTDCIM